MSNNPTKNIKAIERGKRVRFLRSYIAAMTGKEFAKYCGLTRGTVTNWERGKGKVGLKEKGANQIVQAMKSVGVRCSLEWLLYGEGDIPTIIDQNKLSRLHYPGPEIIQPERICEPGLVYHEGFSEEVTLFKKRYPAHLLHTFQDESMTPIYYPYDCVGGPRLAPHQLKITSSTICIILLQPDKVFVRRVKFESPEKKVMSFYGVNSEAALEHPPMARVPVESIIAIAPVTRLWRNIEDC